MSKVLFNIAYTGKNPPAKLTGADRAAYVAQRQFYNMTADYNYLTYMLNQDKVEKNKDAFDYFTRSGTNTGLFNMDGVISEEKAAGLKEKLAKTDSMIWHGFISFNEETSKGFQTQAQAIKFLKQSFNGFIDRTHLKRDNIELFAALHTDTPHHHHIHFSFFEKAPKHRDKYGKLVYTTKGKIHDGAISNYLVAANMHVAENSRDYYTARDRAMDKFKALRAPSVIAYGEKDLIARLNSLSGRLPKSGRFQYNAASIAPYRTEIDELAVLLMRSNPEAYKLHQTMTEIFAKHEQEVIRLARENKLGYVNGRRLSKNEIKELLEKGKTKYIDEKHVDLQQIDYVEKLRRDYKARLGNQVLGLIKNMKREYRQERRAKVNDKGLKINARRNRASARRTLQLFLKALGDYQKRTQTDFTKSLEEIRRENQRQQELSGNG